MSRARPAPPLDTQRRQRRASDPGQSAWVSANAGSGKTHVLAARVIRLLLAGVEPAGILCLTYTKAAAANMATRIFGELARWAVLEEAKLAAAIADLTGAPAARRDLAAARRLFARAVETPGGLKIQTIHGFCERVLQRFPFEGNVAGDFRVLEAADAEGLLAAAVDGVARDGADAPGLAAALARVASEASDEGFGQLLRDFAGAHRGFLRGAGRSAAGRAAALARVAAAHGVDAATPPEGVLAAYFGPDWFDRRFADAALALEGGGPKDNQVAAAIRAVAAAPGPDGAFAALGRLFLTADGDPRAAAGFASKQVGELQVGIRDHLVAEQARWLEAREHLRAARLLARTGALHNVAAAAFAGYEQAKARLGALDFADLVDKTLALVRKLDAEWVMHRLDRGLRHILIDEAQDTSPAQWSIVDRLAAELTAGEGQLERRRTLFVVGDEKQSIYGFQGAAPAGFGEWRHEFQRRHARAGLPFQPVSLTLSFRSTEDVLAAVDAVFARPAARDGLVFDGAAGAPPHQSLDPREPGFVDLWPVARAEPEPEVADAIGAPVDAPDPGSAALRLADRVARYVGDLLRRGDPTGRPVAAGDVMILVRRRGPLFEAMIRALKRAGLPVAGADRLVLGRHIAVMDLVALGHAMLTEADDFSLACVLKSPLIGLDDDDLMAFAPERPGTLWRALADAAATDDRLAATLRKLRRWRKAATAGGPFAFYARALEADGGRRALLARLGPDAAEAIDTFLARALDHERDEIPTLTGFLARFEAVEGEIKRDLDQRGAEVRVMTVHGAKGLEAPIVILPDTTALPPASQASPLVGLALADEPAPVPVWTPRKEDVTPVVAQAKAQAREAELREQRRLLYVAMTRAENGLVICGHEKRKGGKDDAKLVEDGSWYDLVEAGLTAPAGPGPALTACPAFDGAGDIRRWRRPGLRAAERETAAAVAAPAEPPPDWLRRPAPAETPEAPPLKPSQVMDAADRLDRAPEPGAAGASETARQRGILAHRLLEALAAVAPGRRPAEGARLSERHGGGLMAAERAQALAQALRVLDAPALASLFAPGSLAEVAVAGRVTLPDGTSRAVAGRIDRLAVTPERLLIADFKTAAPPADAAGIRPAGIAQLALYRELVAGLAGGRAVACFVVYLAGPVVIELPPATLDAALAGVTLA